MQHETKPPEGSYEEIYWLRGYEAGVADMRTEKPLRMLADLYCRHYDAARDKDETARKRLFDLIAEFEWAFPATAAEHKNRYAKD